MHVLFAIDIRQPDLPARIAQAVHWAGTLDARVDLLYVSYDFGELAGLDLDGSTLAAQIERVKRKQQETLEKLAEGIPEDMRGSCIVLHDPHVGEAIATLASGYGALIVHTHGRKGIRRLLLGSVAANAIRQAEVPTIVLRVPE